MKKLLFISLIAVVVMQSCSSRVLDLPETDNQEQQITARLGFATRAIVTDADAFDIDFVRMDNPIATNTYSFTTVGTGSRASSTQKGEVIFANQYYNKDNDHAYFRCFNHLEHTNANKTMTWTLDGKSDLLASDVWHAGSYVAPTTSPIEFKHLLSKIEVKCQAKSAGVLAAVQALWGSITKISVSTNQKVVYDYGKDVFSYTTPINQPLWAGNTDNPIVNAVVLDFGSAEVTASAMLPPSTSETISLQITTSLKGTRSVDVALPGGLVAGKVHTITLYLPNILSPITKLTNDQEQYTYLCSTQDW